MTNISDKSSGCMVVGDKAPGSGGSGSGEANTSSNSGGGEGLALAKSGVDLPFKTLTEGDGISFTPSADELEIAADPAAQFTDTDQPNGFITPETAVTVSWTDGTRTFEISPTGGSFVFYSNGLRYEKSSAESIQISNDEGIHYIYYNGATLAETQTFTPAIIEEYAIAAIIYWKPSLSAQIYWGREHLHGTRMGGTTHRYLHQTRGYALQSGGGLTNIDADASGNDDTSCQFGNEASECWDEDAQFSLAARLSTANIPVYYREGADTNNYWNIDDTDSFPVIRATGPGRAQWNENNAGTWQLTEVDNSDFLLAHILATNDTDRPFVALVGQAEYNTLGAARDGAETEIVALITAGMPFAEFKFLGTLVLQTNDSYSNGAGTRIRSTNDGGDYVDTRETEFTGTSAPTTLSHNSLSGLQGGTPGEFNHITDSELLDVQAITMIQAKEAVLTSDVSTTSELPTWADVPGLSITLTTGANKIHCAFTIGAEFVTTDGKDGEIYFRLVLDGSNLAASGERGKETRPLDAGIIAGSAVTAGSHTVKVQWALGEPGTGKIEPVSEPDWQHGSLVVYEIKV